MALLPASGAHAAPYRELFGGGVGWTALAGGGSFARTNGVSLDACWSHRIGEGAVYLGFTTGASWLAGKVVASDPESTALGVQGLRGVVGVTLVPLLGTVRLRRATGAGVYLATGLGLGPVATWSGIDSATAFGGTVSAFQLVPAASVPLAVEVPFRSILVVAELRLLATSDLTGAETDGHGVAGALRTVTLSLGWRWGRGKERS